MKIAFLGGSFNPPHKGHLQVAEFARRATGATKIVFLVTPRNPFKSGKSLPPLKKRVEGLRVLATKRWMEVSDIERRFKLAESIKTVRLLKKLYPNDKLYFVMGTDNMVHFHKWRGFMEILQKMKVVFVNRGGFNLHKAVRRSRFPLWKATVVYKNTVAISSTQLRNGSN